MPYYYLKYFQEPFKVGTAVPRVLLLHYVNIMFFRINLLTEYQVDELADELNDWLAQGQTDQLTN
jgi:hypothetical protein